MQVIKLNPKFAKRYNSRAWAYIRSGEAAKGLPDANKAIELDPKNATAYATRGHIFEALDRKDEAISDFRKALELDPSDEDFKENLNRLRRYVLGLLAKSTFDH
jgi:Tfp pilus assembly protein PilF